MSGANINSQHLLVSYSTFKLASSLGIVYYTTQPSGYFGFCVSEGRIYSCLIDKTEDIADFDTNLKPQAYEAASPNDALGLILLNNLSDNSIKVSSDYYKIVHAKNISSSGNDIFVGLQGNIIDFIVNIVGPITGLLPGITYTIQEIDPINKYTLLGSPTIIGPLTTVGITISSHKLLYSNAVKISWTLTGTATICNNIYSRILTKAADSSNIQGELNDGYLATDIKPVLIGGSDGNFLRTFKFYDLDTNIASTDFNLGVSIRLPSDGGSVQGGTSSNPIRVDPTGNTIQPISISNGIDNVGISTVGAQKALKVDVIQSVGGSVGTSSAFGITFPALGTAIGFSDGVNMQTARVFDLDSSITNQYVLGVNLRKSSNGGSIELGTNTNPIKVDPTGTTIQPISASSLPLPSNASTETTLSSRLSDSTFTSRINTLGQKTASASMPVVIASNQSVLPVTIVDGAVGGVQKTLYEIGSTEIYIGTAAQGTAASASGWLIKKITLQNGNPISTLYSSDTAIWENRINEIYS